MAVAVEGCVGMTAGRRRRRRRKRRRRRGDDPHGPHTAK